MSGSRTQKKKFDGCGHRGYGEYCHYCKQIRDGYDFKKDKGKTDKERTKEAKPLTDARTRSAEAEQDDRAVEQEMPGADAEAEEFAEKQMAEEEERHKDEEYQPPPEDFGG